MTVTIRNQDREMLLKALLKKVNSKKEHFDSLLLFVWPVKILVQQ